MIFVYIVLGLWILGWLSKKVKDIERIEKLMKDADDYRPIIKEQMDRHR
jgi:hypothetical protein